jgi:flagellar assembly protein FliH
MSMSSNGLDLNGVMSQPIRTLVYLDMASRSTAPEGIGQSRAERGEEEQSSRRRAEVEFSHEEFAQRIQAERAAAVLQTEQRMRGDYDHMLEAERQPVRAMVSKFMAQLEEYFARAEAEIVQLSLAIAAKILHREAQVDPMLVATLVRMAVEKMREGSSVTIRVGVGEVSRWEQYFTGQAREVKVQVVGDGQLSDHDCMVETELGMANFGLDTQLKEVEQGFFDLMALRPVKG